MIDDSVPNLTAFTGQAILFTAPTTSWTRLFLA
jgi:hypothetical protein